jgi:hypothetical protein
MRYVAPYLISIFIKKAQKKMMQDMGQDSPPSFSKKAGEVNVDYIPKKNKKDNNKDDMGDYVDFEDVKE